MNTRKPRDVAETIVTFLSPDDRERLQVKDAPAIVATFTVTSGLRVEVRLNVPGDAPQLRKMANEINLGTAMEEGVEYTASFQEGHGSIVMWRTSKGERPTRMFFDRLNAGWPTHRDDVKRLAADYQRALSLLPNHRELDGMLRKRLRQRIDRLLGVRNLTAIGNGIREVRVAHGRDPMALSAADVVGLMDRVDDTTRLALGLSGGEAALRRVAAEYAGGVVPDDVLALHWPSEHFPEAMAEIVRTVVAPWLKEAEREELARLKRDLFDFSSQLG